MSILGEIAGGRFITLPGPIQAGLFTLAGILTLGSTWFVVGSSPSRNMAMIIVAVGLMFVFLLFMLFRAIVKWNAKRKANPLAQGIAGNAAAAPQGISEPARRARLDDLRRNFEQGVEKFRAAGKNLYSVPWYVLVGEPGSGKTEAIRHCNVGFPPGLQDQLQGAGGTLNMNWWFTNAAIILDTAGRLMFEEVAPGSTNEWNEFLKLLKQNRPNCPINGMLLVIPVDTLIKDSADAIEKKATKIAQQFDQIQRILGVRFPVFVIITKCDLLNGFREFFDDLNDPQLQHQIMGWSNPAPLDERFDPVKVTAHIESVKQRLIARRQNLLLDPVHTEDPQARRVDQVDSLYALPDSLTKIAPRLRRYLEMIFVAGEWSPKPLFLRGIYFTSSMTEGAALDAELAEALGVPVDSLPGGAIFRKDRAYFLRDLFLEKVFREKGLVTRASNADKQQQTRRLVVLGFAFLAVLVLFAVTWFGAAALRKSLGSELAFWRSASEWNLKEVSIINARKNNAYFGEPSITVTSGSKPVSLPELFGDNLDRVKSDLSVPVIFRPMAVFSGNINVERRIAYRNLYESTVLRPVYSLARTKIPGDSWDPKKGPAALAEMMKLEYASATGKAPGGVDVAHPQVEVASLFALALTDEDYAKFQKDNENLQKVADWIYTPGALQGSKDQWPPKILGAGTPANLDAIKAGVAATVNYWKSQATDDGKALANIKDVREALVAFREAEAALNVATKGATIDKWEVYKGYRDTWKLQMDKLRAAGKRASEAWVLATAGKSDADSLRKLYEDQKSRMLADAQKSYDTLLALTPPADTPANNDGVRTLLAARTTLEEARKSLLAWSTTPEAKATLDDLSALDAAYIKGQIKGLDKENHRRFEVYEQIYELADKMVVKDDAATAVANLSDAFAQADKEYTEATNSLKQPLFQGGEQLTQAGALAQFTVEASARAKKYLLADAALKDMPDTADKWQKIIQSATANAGIPDSLRRPAVPLVTFGKNEKLADDEKVFSPLFTPDVAGAAADKLDTITKMASASDAASKILDPRDLDSRATAARRGFNSYRDQYVAYWRDTVREELKFSFAKFSDFTSGLVNVTEPGINGALEEYRKKIIAALDRIGATDDVNTIRSAPRVDSNECKNALARWGELGTDARQARRIVLGLEAVLFRSDYFVATARTSDSFIAQYWRELPLAALSALAKDGRKDIDDSLAALAKFERFPLAPVGDKKDDLQPDDVLQARAALEKVRGASSTAVTSTGAPKIIGQGATTAVVEIDALLKSLRGIELFANKQAYFDKLDKFLAGMPVDGKPLTVTLSVNKTKLKDEDTKSISVAYSFMPVYQGGKLLREINLIATSTESATVEYAGGDLVFKFRETRDGAESNDVSFPQPWGILRLLADEKNVKSATREGNKWNVEYAITTADKRTLSLWLILEFSQPLPDRKDWPVPPGK